MFVQMITCTNASEFRNFTGAHQSMTAARTALSPGCCVVISIW